MLAGRGTERTAQPSAAVMHTRGHDAAGAFEELFSRHHRPVLAYALRRSASSADAEDAAAETFTIAWRRLADVPDDPLPWLYGVARRVIANQRRSHQRGLRLHTRLREEARPEAVYQTQDAAGDTALAVLSRLRPDDQELLRLIAWEELSHAQIAEVIGISVNAVGIRVHRARERFAAAFGQIVEAEVKGFGDIRTHVSLKGRIIGRMRREETR